ncbi:MAG: IS5 family transposase [Negativicutes bacterium]
MYRKPSPQMTLNDFILPFAGGLSADNRWVRLSKLIPWEEIEKEYAFLFPSDRGNVAKPVRMALGSLIIQARCGYTDRELMAQIAENPYLQYFIGLKEFQLTRPFTPVALVKFRKRFNHKRLAKINELIFLAESAEREAEKKTAAERSDDENQTPGGGKTNCTSRTQNTATSKATDLSAVNEKPNQGTRILDATCTPADIHYPTDSRLLNEAREKLDEMIDVLHKVSGKPVRRPRTYRQKARRDYLLLSKQKKPGNENIRVAIRKQLQYAGRNLKIVETLLGKWIKAGGDHPLSKRHQKLLVTIKTVLAQQQTMYKARSHRVDDRIVNLYQPHVRPIVRGKAGAPVEFGAKVAISLENGFSRIEKLSWNPFNESGTLIESAENYQKRCGHYPEAILADQIYRNRANLNYCKENKIRLSGPRLGRALEDTKLRNAETKIVRQDVGARNAVEGKFDEGKRKYSLDRIFAKLKETAECVIAMQFLVMNLEPKLRVLIVQILNVLCWNENELIFEAS